MEIGSDGNEKLHVCLSRMLMFYRAFKLSNEQLQHSRTIPLRGLGSLVLRAQHQDLFLPQSAIQSRSRNIWEAGQRKRTDSQRGLYNYKCPCSLPSHTQTYIHVHACTHTRTHAEPQERRECPIRVMHVQSVQPGFLCYTKLCH